MSSDVGNKPRKFLSDVIWVGLSQMFAMLFGIITIPALTKTYSTETYGIWTQLMVTIALIAPIVNLQLGSSVNRFLAAEEDKTKRLHYLGSMLSTVLIFATFILLVANMIPSQVSVLLFGSSQYVYFVRLAFLWIYIDALFYFLLTYFQAKNEIRRTSVIQVSMLIARMLSIVILAKIGMKLDTIVICIIIIGALFTLFTFFLIVREDGFPVPNFRKIKTFLAFSVPQIPSEIMKWIIGSSDRVLITQFIGLAATGIYATSTTLGGIISLFYVPIGYVLLPTVSKAWDNNRLELAKSYFEYSVKLFLTLAIPGAIGLVILSQPILKILATSDYLAGWQLILVMTIATIFFGWYTLNIFIIYLVKKTKWIPVIFLVTSIISLGLNLILIPHIGIMGAAISRLTAYFILGLIVFIWARNILRYRIDVKYLGKVVAATAIMGVCLYFIKPDNILGIILFTLAGIALFAIFIMLFRAFNAQDKRLIKQYISGVLSHFHFRSR